MRIIDSIIVVGVALVAVALANEEPSCPDAAACSLYWYDYAVYAGRNIKNNEAIGWPNDVAVEFTQQSRRGFPRWNRYHHLYQTPGTPYKFTYAPGTEWPLECHDRLYNVRITDNSTFALKTDRPIPATEPIFVECVNDEFSKGTPIEDLSQVPLETLEKKGICLDLVEIKDAGVFAKTTIKQHATVAFGKALHMHRAEFYNETADTYEELLNYCWGHPSTDLLILPNAPIISSIRHNSKQPNVQLEWDFDGDNVAKRFSARSEFLFKKEEAWMWVKVKALRDVNIDEELYMDFGGDQYEKAVSSDVPHERIVPAGFLPDRWLKRETRSLASEMPHFVTTKLAPGQVKQALLNNGEPLGSYLHRVGFPEHLADTIQEWGQEIGVLDFVRRYIDDKTLDRGEEERARFNNGTWWTRRFPSSWQSNMHYVAVDDDESNEQFFHALARGGFDQVLAGIGSFFNLTTLTAFYPTFIVVNHCVQAYMHSDSDYPNIFNMIFPIIQVDNGEPELILGADPPGKLHVPYTYERDHGILVGKDGMHGTAPTDYRGYGGYRVVASVYMGDFSEDDDDVQQFIDDWEDPPYPNYYPGQLHHALTQRVHWSKDDPAVSIGDPMPRKYPLNRPEPKKSKRTAIKP